MSKPAHIAAKEKSWERQAAALDAPAYRITLTDPTGEKKPWNLGKGKGPDGTEKTYTAAEVRDMIPMLSAKNAQGRAIYVTPVDPKNHYMVLDDTDKDRLQTLKDKGFSPALVQESSPGNIQAIFKTHRENTKTEQEAANAVVMRLNKQFGDPNFSGVVHPFRLAGFTNTKPQYKDDQGNSPFVQIREAPGGPCPKMATALAEPRQKASSAAKKKAQAKATVEAQERSRMVEIVGRSSAFSPHGEHQGMGLTEIKYQFYNERYKAEKLAESKGWPLDDSKLDFRACKDLLKTRSPEDVETVLKECSPAIETRHQNLDNYASRTVAAAEKSLDQDRAQYAAQDRDRGPSMSM